MSQDTPMKSVLDAARTYFQRREGVRAPLHEEPLVLAFIAGAAWQREQDAKICEADALIHRTEAEPDTTWAALAESLAAKIRAGGTPLRDVGNAAVSAVLSPPGTRHDCTQAMGGSTVPIVNNGEYAPPKTKLRHRCEALDAQGLTMTDGDECPECGEKFPTRSGA